MPLKAVSHPLRILEASRHCDGSGTYIGSRYSFGLDTASDRTQLALVPVTSTASGKSSNSTVNSGWQRASETVATTARPIATFRRRPESKGEARLYSNAHEVEPTGCRTLPRTQKRSPVCTSWPAGRMEPSTLVLRQTLRGEYGNIRTTL